MKLGFIADLHLDLNGITQNEAYSTILKVIEEKQLDRLFLCGDTYNDGYKTRDLAYALNNALEGKAEVYYIFGNHDMYSTKLNNYTKAEMFQDMYYLNGRVLDLPGTDVCVIGTNGWYDGAYYKSINYPKEFEARLLEEANTNKPKLTNKLKDSEIVTYECRKLEALLRRVPEGKEVVAITHFVPNVSHVTYKDDNPVWELGNAYIGSQRFGDIMIKAGVKKCYFGHNHTRIKPSGIFESVPLGEQLSGHWETETLLDELMLRVSVLEV